MDELTAYVFQYYRRLLTSQEWETYLALNLLSQRTRTADAMLAKAWQGREEELKEMMARVEGDPDKYLDSVRTRILRDHPDEVHVNRCAKCGGLARTPLARQCLKCGYDWHEAP